MQAAIAATRGRIELYSGRVAIAREVYQVGADALADEDPEKAAALLAVTALAAYTAGEAAAAVQLARDAMESAGCSDANTHLNARFVLGMALVVLGREDEGVRCFREAAELLDKSDPTMIDVESTLFVAMGMVWIGDAAAARLVIDPVVYRLRAAGALGQLPFALYVSALADSRLGRLDSGRAAAAESVDLATSIGDLLTLCLALGCLALLEAQRGDEQACRAHAAESLRLRALANFVDIGGHALEGLGLLELSLGRPQPAIAHLTQANHFQHSDEPSFIRSSSIDLVEACVRGGQDMSTSFRHLQWVVELDLPAALGA